jgi:regulator of sirC expression with transglutaminase-like and TPR domain
MDLNAKLAELAGQREANVDVAEVALCLARDEYPELDVEAYLCELEGMAREARDYVRGNLERRVSGLCRYLFHEMGFRGNAKKYYDPRNSYLNRVIDRRTGIPITLSVVAMAIGKRVGLEIQGVGLPGHFIVKASAAGQELLFDPFHGGRLLTPEDCEILVERKTGQSFSATPENLEPILACDLLTRMLTNLKAVYFRQKDYVRALRVVERLRQLNPCDPMQRRDLGIGLLQSGEPGRALDHLTAYLRSSPGCEDGESIRLLVNEAYSAIGQWN